MDQLKQEMFKVSHAVRKGQPCPEVSAGALQALHAVAGAAVDLGHLPPDQACRYAMSLVARVEDVRQAIAIAMSACGNIGGPAGPIFLELLQALHAVPDLAARREGAVSFRGRN